MCPRIYQELYLDGCLKLPGCRFAIRAAQLKNAWAEFNQPAAEGGGTAAQRLAIDQIAIGINSALQSCEITNVMAGVNAGICNAQ